MKNCKKKILCGFLAGAVLFASGCGNKDTQDQAKVQRYAWPLGSSSPEDTVTQIYAEKFAEEVKICAALDCGIEDIVEIVPD